MLKKGISVFLAVLLVFSLFSVAAFAQTTQPQWIYEIRNGTAVITGLEQQLTTENTINGIFTIPDEIDGYPLSAIDPVAVGAFASSSVISAFAVSDDHPYFSTDESGVLLNKDQSVLLAYPSGSMADTYVVPLSVTLIEDLSFSSCNHLKNLTISENVKFVGSEEANSGELKEWEVSPFFCLHLDTLTYDMKYLSEKYINICYPEYSCKKMIIGPHVEKIDFTMPSESGMDYRAYTIFHADELEVSSENPYYSMFHGLVYDKAQENLLFIPMNWQPAQGFAFPDTLIEIPDYYRMENCGMFLSSLPDDIQTIGAYAFDSANIYQTTILHEKVQEVRKRAFVTNPIMDGIVVLNPNCVLGEESVGYSTYILAGDRDYALSCYREIFDCYRMGEEEKAAELLLEVEQELAAGRFRIVTAEDTPIPDPEFTLYGFFDSTAEAYARENGMNFVPLCEKCHSIMSQDIIEQPTYVHEGSRGWLCPKCGHAVVEEILPVLTIEESEEKTDEQTDVAIIYPEGAFDGKEVEISVSPVADEDAYQLISHKEGNYKVTMFDIAITSNAQPVQPNGTVMVRIPLPRGYNQNKCVVYYVADDGTMEELKTYHFKDGYVYFETDHFSYYAILEEEQTQQNLLEELLSFFRMIVDAIRNLFQWLLTLFANI